MGCGPVIPMGLELNFKDPQLQDDECEIHGILSESLYKAPTVLQILKDYVGCGVQIYMAFASPTPENEEAAWGAVVECAEKITDLYKFYQELEIVWYRLLTLLFPQNPITGVQSHLSSIKQLSQIFQFIFEFDRRKILNLALQNDLSYYRRILNQRKLHKISQASSYEEEVLRNRTSMFYSEAAPMMHAFIHSIFDHNFQRNLQENILFIPGLSLLCNLCLKFLETPQEMEEEKLALCCMTGCIILVDNLDPAGAYHKNTSIRIEDCIKKLCASKKFALENTIRINSRNLFNIETPSSIKN